jgi:hypothetical protein
MSASLFSTAYFAPVQYYWHWRRSNERYMEAFERYPKQTWRNRCLIGSANGPMALSIPVEGGADKKSIRDVRLSEHGNWRHLHWYSIESAYNSSPFFEYYADDLRPFIEKKTPFLFDFNEEIRIKIFELLEIEGSMETTVNFIKEEDLAEGWADYRNIFNPKNDFLRDDPSFSPKPYYQVFDRKFGFKANLSILDLLFNMGPESILFL